MAVRRVGRPVRWQPAAARLLVGALYGGVAGAVNCGGHSAVSCEECPQGNGFTWCNGDCAWRRGECIPADQAGDETEDADTPAGGFTVPPDTRPRECSAPSASWRDADLSHLKVSVVLPWHREKWEHLRGTVMALLKYTPDELIEEYLFVSDGNSNTRAKELKALTPKARTLALKTRQGLIRAKMKGVAVAKGPVIMFMEAHCIVNRDWLQPLLHRLVLYPRALAMPTLDYIPQENWHQYSKIPAGHWRFEWNLNLVYTNPGGALDHTAEPYLSPGTSGGIFVMRKDWFQELKLFDPGMYEWGGDHLELTMKVWRCGGRIEIIPCSRIGHLYRNPDHRPYDVNVMRVVENYARLARIWFKDHLDLFYQMKPEARPLKFTDMAELMEQHDQLQCKNLTWYLENVDHEMHWEMDKICHPYVDANDPVKCKGELAPSRWTLVNADLMPRDEFLKERKRVAGTLGVTAGLAAVGGATTHAADEL